MLKDFKAKINNNSCNEYNQKSYEKEIYTLIIHLSKNNFPNKYKTVGESNINELS